MNVNKIMTAALLGVLALAAFACSATAGPTPTRTPRSAAQNGNPTQTPWIIYMPVTSTPEPATVTPLPTITTAATAKPPAAAPTKTKPKPTAAPVKPVAVVSTATPAATATPQPPACGQSYQVTSLTWPLDNAPISIKQGTSDTYTIQFKWNPVTDAKLDPTIGYRVTIQTPVNGAQLYVSHNQYLVLMNQNGLVMNQMSTWGLTGGKNQVATWYVNVVKASGGFNDNAHTLIGTDTECGPASPVSHIRLLVIQ